MECARCHDHKYDPISQQEYYQLFSFFNNTDEIGHAVYGPDQTPGPALLLTTPAEDRNIDSLQAEIARLELNVKTSGEKALSYFESWLENAPDVNLILNRIDKKRVAHYPFDRIRAKGGKRISSNRVGNRSPATLSETELTEGKFGRALQITDYSQIKLGEGIGWFGRTDPFSIDFWIYPDTMYEDAMLFTHSEEWRLGLRGYTLHLEKTIWYFRMAHSYPQNAMKSQRRP